MTKTNYYTMQREIKRHTTQTPSSTGRKIKVRVQLPSLRSLAIIFIVAIVLLVVVVKASGWFAESEAVAKVNGDKITLKEFTSLLKIEQEKRDPILLKDPKLAQKFKQDVLESLIKEQLILQEAKKAGVTPTEEEIEQEILRFKSNYSENTFQAILKDRGISYKDWKDLKIKKLTISKFLDQQLINNVKTSDNEIENYYHNHISEFSKPEEVHARQITVDSYEKAQEIEEELKKGANFAVLATKYSISPDSKKGGDLGSFRRGVYPPIFDEVCFSSQAGKISKIVKSEYGFHIFKVIAKKPARIIPLSETKDIVIARIRQGESSVFFDNWYNPIREKAKIEINNDILSRAIIPESS